MAKKKVLKTEEDRTLTADLALTQRKAMKVTCLNCGASRPIVSPDVRAGYGGIKCTSCNKYDNFYGEFKIGDEICSLVTVPYYDQCDTKTARLIGRVSYVLRCHNAGNICGFFKENEYSASEINNAILDLGINLEGLKKYYPATSSPEATEKQVVREEKLARKLKKVIKE